MKTITEQTKNSTFKKQHSESTQEEKNINNQSELHLQKKTTHSRYIRETTGNFRKQSRNKAKTINQTPIRIQSETNQKMIRERSEIQSESTQKTIGKPSRNTWRTSNIAKQSEIKKTIRSHQQNNKQSRNNRKAT